MYIYFYSVCWEFKRWHNFWVLASFLVSFFDNFLSSICFITFFWNFRCWTSWLTSGFHTFFLLVCTFLFLFHFDKFPQLYLLSLLLKIKILAIFLYSKCFSFIFSWIYFFLLFPVLSLSWVFSACFDCKLEVCLKYWWSLTVHI